MKVTFPGPMVKERHRTRSTFSSQMNRVLKPGEEFEIGPEHERFVRCGLLRPVDQGEASRYVKIIEADQKYAADLAAGRVKPPENKAASGPAAVKTEVSTPPPKSETSTADAAASRGRK